MKRNFLDIVWGMNRLSLERHKSSMIRLHIWDSWANWATMEGMSLQITGWWRDATLDYVSTSPPLSSPIPVLPGSLTHKQDLWLDQGWLTSLEDLIRTTNQKYWIDQAKIKGSSLELNYSNKTRSQHIEEKQLMRLTGGPSFVFYRSQGEEILQLISSWKRPHYRPTSNTSHCQAVNIDFFKI